MLSGCRNWMTRMARNPKSCQDRSARSKPGLFRLTENLCLLLALPPMLSDHSVWEPHGHERQDKVTVHLQKCDAAQSHLNAGSSG